ncbi:MAG: hypothetical protein RL030_2766 [Pseudomonadota bacterium]|jgi:hypothetical protein
MAVTFGLPGALPDITAWVQQLKDVYVYRWMREAQKAAVNAWMQRAIGPGVKARFTDAGARFYGFTNRNGFYDQWKGYLPDFVLTGSFRDQVLARKPRSANTGGGDVITRVSIYGGVLNALSGLRGEINVVRSRVTEVVTVPSYTRVQNGVTKTIKGYQQSKSHTKVTSSPAPKTYAEEYAVTSADIAWVQAETQRQFHAIVAKRGINKRSGGLRAKVRAAAADDSDEKEAA